MNETKNVVYPKAPFHLWMKVDIFYSVNTEREKQNRMDEGKARVEERGGMGKWKVGW